MWIGQTASSAGDSVMGVAIVFAVLRIGGTAADIGIVVGVQTVCKMIFVLVGGVWADRLPRQFVMLSADLIRGGVQVALAVLLLTGHAHIWQLAVGGAIFGSAEAFFAPASTGLLPEMLPADLLPQGNALLSFSNSFTTVGGPAIAGVIIAAFSPGVLFALDGASFCANAIALSMLKLPPRKISERESFRSELAAGWHEMAIRPWYWLNLIAHTLWNFAFPAYFVLGPVIAARSLGGASAWGAIAASFSAGAVAGGLFAGRARPRRPLVAANLALVLTVLPVLALARPAPTWVVAVAAAMCGLGLIFLNTVWNATMQQLIPQEVISRVNSYDWLISLLVMPAGYVLVGPIADNVGFAPTLIGAAVLLGAPPVLAALIPGVRAVRRTADGKVVGPPLRQTVTALAPTADGT